MDLIFVSNRISKSGELGTIKSNSVMKVLSGDKRVNSVVFCDSMASLCNIIKHQHFHYCLACFDEKFTDVRKAIHLLHLKRIKLVVIGKKSDHIKYACDWKAYDFILLPFTKYHIDWMMSRLYSVYDNHFDILQKEIFFKVKNSRLVRVSLNNIAYFESLGNHVKIMFNSSQRLIIYSTMKALELRLPSNNFVRIHKSYLVNISKVSSIEGNSVVVDGKSIPVSRSNWKALMGMLETI